MIHYEVYITKSSEAYLAIYKGNGNEYIYFKIDKYGVFSVVECLNDCYKNDYYIDYLNSEILDNIQKMVSLFSEKEEEKEEEENFLRYNSDDIPF